MLNIIHKCIFYLAELLEHRNISSFSEILCENEKREQEDISREQVQKIREMLIYAYTYIPYYKNLFDSIDFKPGQFIKINDLKKIPYLTKDIIKNNEKLFINKDNNKKIIARKTGGSTGRKLIVYYGQRSLDITAAVHQRCMGWCGKLLGEREIHLSSKTIEQRKIPIKDRRKEHFKCLAMNRENVFLDIFDDKNIKDILYKIKSMKAVLIQGFPSIAYNLASFAQENDIDVKGTFKYYESTGETLYDFQREKIEKIFGCEVYDRYGDAEFGVIAHECANHNGLHIMEDVVFVESEPSKEIGSMGEIIVTTLTNYTMPLIRYKTGDLGEISQENCSCGLPFRKIINMSGRIHDFLKIADGKNVSTSFILDILDKYNGIRNFQIRLKANVLEFLVIPDDNFTLDVIKAIQEELNIKLGLLVDIYLIDKLYLTPMGKYRYLFPEDIELRKILCLARYEYGSIYNNSSKNSFIKISSMLCIDGFNELEITPDNNFIWSKCNAKVCFEEKNPYIEILSSVNTDQVLQICNNDGVVKQKINLSRGWDKYTINANNGEIILLKINHPISAAEKKGDKRELGIGFREILNNDRGK
ncbi:phenylacetate--CoA ligase family protein [Pectinatus haikarae]|uniref:Phenylacetate-CoA ligase n=1 Tax=Pectinatus haikarae TaxID=349096 RepID=A0ABT9YBG4_9FIRM|nr:hypothetical protein [Pectinatus haikarae]MDQ0205188.1 phenylacetate-CoA ligase [Pectinatus haikarae]